MKRAALLVLMGTFFWWGLTPPGAAAEANLTWAERFVLEKAAQGEMADLEAEFTKNDYDRHLSAQFLTALLTGERGYPVQRKGIRIRKAVIMGDVDLELAEVPFDVILVSCQFRGDFSVEDAIFKKHLILNESQFEKSVNFHRAKIAINLFCRNAVFKGPTDFAYADIGGQFSASGAEFFHEEGPNFQCLKVGVGANLDRSAFWGRVDFKGADISGQLSAEDAWFLNPKNPVDFEGVQVGQAALLRNVIMRGGADFSYGSYRYLLLDGSPGDTTESLLTSRARQNRAYEPLRREMADQQKRKELVVFQALNPGAFLAFLIAAGEDSEMKHLILPWVLNPYAFLQLFINDLTDRVPAGRDVVFTFAGTVIKGRLDVLNFQMSRLEARHLQVKGPATLKALTLVSRVSEDGLDEASPDDPSATPARMNLQSASIETLRLSNILWGEGPTTDPKGVRIDGLTYTSLCVDDEPESLEKLLRLPTESAFNTQNYLQLEEFCRRTGHRDWADRVYIAMRDRELEQKNGWWEGVVKLFWGKLTGYGREPERVILPVIIVIAIGFCLFDPRCLKKEKRAAWQLSFHLWRPSFLPDIFRDLRHGNIARAGGKLKGMGKLVLIRFLVSLDQFIPAINLKIAENWQPCGFGRWLWLKLQAISGWILVPIGLAAIFSQLK